MWQIVGMVGRAEDRESDSGKGASSGGSNREYQGLPPPSTHCFLSAFSLHMRCTQNVVENKWKVPCRVQWRETGKRRKGEERERVKRKGTVETGDSRREEKRREDDVSCLVGRRRRLLVVGSCE